MLVLVPGILNLGLGFWDLEFYTLSNYKLLSIIKMFIDIYYSEIE